MTCSPWQVESTGRHCGRQWVPPEAMYNPVGSEQAVPGTGLCKQLSTLSPYSQVFYPQPHPGTKQMEPASSQRSEQERAHQKPAGIESCRHPL